MTLASRRLVALVPLLALAAPALAAGPIRVAVDATEAPRKLFRATLVLPAAPGPLALVYPKWIPGEHAPTGPIADLGGIELSAAGRKVSWTRDPHDMFTLRCTVPDGATELTVKLEYLSPTSEEGFTSAANATEKLAVLAWNQLILYPQDAPVDALTFEASLAVPVGWTIATALAARAGEKDPFAFAPVPMTTLVDSPVLMGAHLKDFVLDDDRRHVLSVAADSADALAIRPETLSALKKLVAETGPLFGGRPYRSYRFLLTLSDHVASFGLEHHESSDDRVPERYFLDDDILRLHRGLLPHEFVHTWNGKYRRPATLTRDDLHEPSDTSLLWVYEGLTNYYGQVLTVRSGLESLEDFREDLALDAGEIDARRGRTWRSLEDTATAAQILYGAAEGWSSRRRGVDFYDEGTLVWLEADVAIRTRTQGKRSLDDFVRKFHGGGTGKPEVATYTFEDLVAALQDVAPYDWRGFFEARIRGVSERAPLGGIVNGGWKLVWTETRPKMLDSREEIDRETDLRYSVGLRLDADTGEVKDVIQGSPADLAGVGPGMKLVAVGGRRFTHEIVREALRDAKSSPEPLRLLVQNGEWFRTFEIPYHEGERYPTLERDAARPDLLGAIAAPRALPSAAPGR